MVVEEVAQDIVDSINSLIKADDVYIAKAVANSAGTKFSIDIKVCFYDLGSLHCVFSSDGYVSTRNYFTCECRGFGNECVNGMKYMADCVELINNINWAEFIN